MNLKPKKTPFHIARLALDNSDRLTRFEIVLLAIMSLVCACCNVAVPILQKNILSSLADPNDDLLWVYLVVAAVGCVFLLLESVINISILTRLRKELEYVMEESLAVREQPMLQEKGVGIFAGSIMGDAEQLSRVLAASWFSIVFNLIGAIVSIVVSALWNQYFIIIVSVAYVLILTIIFFFGGMSVRYFRKEKEASYTLNAKIREMVDTHRAIMTYGSYLDYRKTFEKEVKERSYYGRLAERMNALSDTLIKLVRAIAIAVFFFVAVHQLRGMSSAEERAAYYPIIVALVSYFETIFVPVGALNVTYSNAAKFRAFFDPYETITSHAGIGEVPQDLGLYIHNVSHIRDGMLILSSLTLSVDGIYGVFGLEGEGKSLFLSYLRGESYPVSGHIALGGARIFEIEKSLRLSLLNFNSTANEIFGSGLEFNLTMGKKLVSDAEYESLWEEYQDKLCAFFEAVDAGDLFRKRRNRALRDEIIGDFLSLDSRLIRQRALRATILAQFQSVQDQDLFIATVGRTVFATKYAKKSRYDAIVRGLELEELSVRPFGVGGQYLTASDKALVILGRFLLPDTAAPFVLVDPLDHVPLDQVKRCERFIKKAISGRKGLIFTQDIELFRSLTDEVLLFEEGHLTARASHGRLIRKSKAYEKLCRDKGLIAKKAEE